jgi:RNA polymerase sigma factor (TIGR02999 family)
MPLQNRGSSQAVADHDTVSRLLLNLRAGDQDALNQLLPLVYHQLHTLAQQQRRRWTGDETLDTTALVHEAYLRLVDVKQAQAWNSRGHFFAAAAEAMRRILVESARRKGRNKHGGGRQRLELDAVAIGIKMPPEHFLALDEALTRLAQCDAQAAQIVKLHCFAGLSIEHVAGSLGISSRTAYRDWDFAQSWLYREIRGTESPR